MQFMTGGSGGFRDMLGIPAAPPAGGAGAPPPPPPAGSSFLSTLAGVGGFPGFGVGGFGGLPGTGAGGAGTGPFGIDVLGGLPGFHPATPVEPERPQPPPGGTPLPGGGPPRPDVMVTGDILRPGIATIDPNLILRFPPILQITKTATQLARSALTTLNEAPPEVLDEALNTLRGSQVAADHLIGYFERRVRIGEVLNQVASTWSDTTVGDFATAMKMDREKRPVMDALVAIAILNKPELDEEILIENTPQTTEQDLLDNRVIVDQWPKGGTVMQPPYMILVAVEYRAVADAQGVVDSIMGELVDHQGVKLPRGAAERLRARG